MAKRKTDSPPKSQQAVGYVRVSTIDQAREGYSVGAQEERIRAYCTAQGLQLAAVFTDEGVSGTTALERRPAGQQLAETLRTGTAHHIVALKLDRLFRSCIDALQTSHAWRNAGVDLHVIDLGGSSVSSGGAAGRLFFTMMAAWAEFERELIAERTATALRRAQAQGRPIGRPGIGFRRIARGQFAIDATAQPTVEKIHRLRTAGITIRDIAAWLNADGDPPPQGGRCAGRWTPSTVWCILNRQKHPEDTNPAISLPA